MSFLSVLVLGFLLGMRHATDADHVVAVTTIVSRERNVLRASLVGVLWGIGHTLTIFLVGGAIILLRVVIPPRLGLAMEFAVALMLIGLGVYNLASDRWPGRDPLTNLRPMLVGVVHGLAGSAAVALLVLATIDDPWWAVGYLGVFGAGTVLGMMLITTTLAVPLAYSAGRFGRVNRYLQFGSGVLSFGFGLFLAVRIGLVDGLFSAHPSWVPH